MCFEKVGRNRVKVGIPSCGHSEMLKSYLVCLIVFQQGWKESDSPLPHMHHMNIHQQNNTIYQAGQE